MPASANRPAAGSSLTLERALNVLALLGEHREGLTVSQIAAALETHRAGVYRLLGPLTDRRLVTRTDDRYLLGVGLVELASGVHARLQEVARPELQQLADDLRATTALTVRDGEEAVVVAVIEPRTTDVHLAYRSGIRHRLDQAAPGIAILASLPPRPGERAVVGEARGRGWSCSRGELIPGATGVAAPVVTAGEGLEASISAVWIEDRDAAAAAERVMRSARAITAALGHGPH